MTTKTILITKKETERFGNQPIQIGLHWLHQLANAGIPASGVIWPQGVKHGQLTARYLPEGVEFTWVGEDDDEDLF